MSKLNCFFLLCLGFRKASEVFHAEHALNRIQLWLYRLLGWFVSFLGLNCVATLLDIIGEATAKTTLAYFIGLFFSEPILYLSALLANAPSLSPNHYISTLVFITPRSRFNLRVRPELQLKV